MAVTCLPLFGTCPHLIRTNDFPSRRDGSPFMNLLMMAPLCDSRGKIRYFIGAQVDVSGLVKESTELESFSRLLESQEQQHQQQDDSTNGGESQGYENDHGHQPNGYTLDNNHNAINAINSNGDTQQSSHRSQPPNPNLNEEQDEFRSLSEMLNTGELSTVRKYGGRMHTDRIITEDGSDAQSIYGGDTSSKGRLLIREPSPDQTGYGVYGNSNSGSGLGANARLNGKLTGIYKHVCLPSPPFVLPSHAYK